MKFNKATYLFFALFFLMTKVGVAFNIHYCGGAIAGISHIFEGKNGCAMELMTEIASPCEKEKKKRSCCDDEVLVIQNTDENPLVNSLELSGKPFIAVLTMVVFPDLTASSPVENTIEIPFENRAHPPPLYQLYCNYTFYA